MAKRTVKKTKMKTLDIDSFNDGIVFGMVTAMIAASVGVYLGHLFQ